MRFLVLALLVAVATCDLYLHNPPGSNDRNRERQDNRQNGNRVFDSQNNANGGYPWAGNRESDSMDPLTYYGGSILRIEWTNQHACGTNPNVHCQVVIQYGCDVTDQNLVSINRTDAQKEAGATLSGIRDGYPQDPNLVDADQGNAGQYMARAFLDNTGGNQNLRGTNRISDNEYANDPEARDAFYYLGKDTSGGNANRGKEYGMHEGIDSYNLCKQTKRNDRLFNADQTLNDGAGARATRQNPNGNRRGLECPEERDYYPYWNTGIDLWHDVAVFTTNPNMCDFYRKNSNNVKPKGYCRKSAANANNNQQLEISEEGCRNQQNIWVRGFGEVDGAGNAIADAPDVLVRGSGRAPFCSQGMLSRDNHLGNAMHVSGDGANFFLGDESRDSCSGEDDLPETAYFNWQIPKEIEGMSCTLRVRYNMSSEDYASQAFAIDSSTKGYTARDQGVGIDFQSNCPRVGSSNQDGDDDPDADQQTIADANPGCFGKLSTSSVPLFNRPYVNIFAGDAKNQRLSIALNTNQNGRTFQDRSYIFNVAALPSTPECGQEVFNLGLRGRRGNIVQAYPAVEYDFVPGRLRLDPGDCVHIQFHGSDFNEAKNANNGEGWQYSSRTNMASLSVSKPIPGDEGSLTTILSRGNFPEAAEGVALFSTDGEGEGNQARYWSFVGQNPEECEEYENGDNGEQNNINNCGKLNRMPNRFPQEPSVGLMLVRLENGIYNYFSTRNNNFSNRSQKAQFCVGKQKTGLTDGEIAAAVVGGVAGGIFLLILLVLCFGFYRPNTTAGGWYSACARRCPCCHVVCGVCGGRSAGAKQVHSPKTTAPPDMAYTRH